MTTQFTNKIIFITGGTSGIGRATAIAFAKAGGTVAFTGRRRKEGEETLKLVEATGATGLFIESDASSETAIQKAIGEVVAKFGRIDVAFNNAGVEGEMGKTLAESTAETFDHVFGINVRGLLLSMKHEFLQFQKQGGGVIINTSSIVGSIGFPGFGIYTASKHAVEGLTKVAALEGAKQNIRVNAVAPGPIVTEMLQRLVGENHDAMGSMMPMGRTGTVDEIASVVLFLASPGASYITGQSLAADGGYLAT